jgi:hypothetical protein
LARRISKKFAWALKGKGEETWAVPEKRIIRNFVAFVKKKPSIDWRHG